MYSAKHFIFVNPISNKGYNIINQYCFVIYFVIKSNNNIFPRYIKFKRITSFGPYEIFQLHLNMNI